MSSSRVHETGKGALAAAGDLVAADDDGNDKKFDTKPDDDVDNDAKNGGLPQLQVLSTEGEIDWSSPPKPQPNVPVQVQVEIQVYRVGQIDIGQQSAQFVINTKLYWVDHRLTQAIQRHYEQNPYMIFHAPDNLWRPGFACDAFEEKYFFITEKEASKDVYVVDKKKGLLLVEMNYNGQVDNPMELDDFPFDEDSIDLTYCGYINRSGGWAHPQDFVFLPCSDHPIQMFCKNISPEWNLIGTWHAATEKEVGSFFSWGIVVRRRFAFYVFNVLIPQVFIFGFTLMCHVLDPIDEVSDRLGLATTMYLVSIALQYVIADSLPKSNKMTRLDWLVFYSSSMILLSVFETALLYLIFGPRVRGAEEVAENYDDEYRLTLNQVDLWFVVVSALSYSTWLLYTFLPPFRKSASKAYKHTWYPSTKKKVSQDDRGKIQFQRPKFTLTGSHIKEE